MAELKIRNPVIAKIQNGADADMGTEPAIFEDATVSSRYSREETQKYKDADQEFYELQGSDDPYALLREPVKTEDDSGFLPYNHPYAYTQYSEDEIREGMLAQDRPFLNSNNKIEFRGREYASLDDFNREQNPESHKFGRILRHFGGLLQKGVGFVQSDVPKEILNTLGSGRLTRQIKELVTDPDLGFRRSLGTMFTGAAAELGVHRWLTSPGMRMPSTPGRKAIGFALTGLAYTIADQIAAIDANLPPEELRSRALFAFSEEVLGQKVIGGVVKRAGKGLQGWRNSIDANWNSSDSLASYVKRLNDDATASLEGQEALNTADFYLPLSKPGKVTRQKIPIGGALPGAAIDPLDATFIDKTIQRTERWLVHTDFGNEMFLKKRRAIHRTVERMWEDYSDFLFGEVTESPEEVGRLLSVLLREKMQAQTVIYKKYEEFILNSTQGAQVKVKGIWDLVNELSSAVQVDKGLHGETLNTQVRATLLPPNILEEFNLGKRPQGVAYATDAIPIKNAMILVKTLKKFQRNNKGKPSAVVAGKMIAVSERVLKEAFDLVDNSSRRTLDNEFKSQQSFMPLHRVYDEMNTVYRNAKKKYSTPLMKKVIQKAHNGSRGTSLNDSASIFKETINSDIGEWRQMMDAMSGKEFVQERALYGKMFMDAIYEHGLKGQQIGADIPGFKMADPKKMLEAMYGTGILSEAGRPLMVGKGMTGYNAREVTERIMGKDASNVMEKMFKLGEADLNHWRMINTKSKEAGGGLIKRKTLGQAGLTAVAAKLVGADFAEMGFGDMGPWTTGFVATSSVLLLHAPRLVSKLYFSPGGQALLRRSMKVGIRSELSLGLINKMIALGDRIDEQIRIATKDPQYVDDAVEIQRRIDIKKLQQNDAGLSAEIKERGAEQLAMQEQLENPFGEEGQGFLPSEVTDPIKKMASGIASEAAGAGERSSATYMSPSQKLTSGMIGVKTPTAFE